MLELRVEASQNIVVLYAVCSPEALCIFNEILNYVTSLNVSACRKKMN